MEATWSLVLFLTLGSCQDGAPPAFLEPVEIKTLSAAENSDVTLKCLATGHPTPSYWWKLNGRRISECSNSGDLTLTNVSAQHKGDYQCMAENEDVNGVTAVAASQPITLNIYRQCTTWRKSNNSRFVRQEFQYLTLECDCPPECLKSKITWFRSEPSLTQINIPTHQGRLYIDTKGTLHFIYTIASDSSSTYQCGVTTPEQFLLGKKYEVSITKVTNPPARPARVRSQTVQTRFLLHQTADLECVFSGHPTPVTTWKYTNGTILPHNGKFELIPGSFRRRLRIRNLIMDDAGSYICSGSNGVTDDVHVDVTVTSKPVWVKPLTDVTVQEGRVAHLSCETGSVGRESQAELPVWYINGDEINPASMGDRRVQFLKDRSVLTIVKVKQSVDAVCFQCKVSNSAGYIFGNGCLKVTKGNRGPVTISKTTILIAAVCSASLVIMAVIFTTFIRRIWKKSWKSDVPSRRSPLLVYTDIEYRQGTPPPPYDQIHLQSLPREGEMSDDDRYNTRICDYAEPGSDVRDHPSVVSQGDMYLTPFEGADDPPPYLSLI